MFWLRFLNKVIDLVFYFPHHLRYKVYYKIHNISSLRFFRGEGIKIYGGGVFSVGVNSYCGINCGFCAIKGHVIIIGNNVSISHNVRIYTSNRNPLDIIGGNDEVKTIDGDVVIGNNVWIGANVIILQGVTIGNNVVIGANSVVSKCVGNNVVVAGAPLRLIKSV